MVRHVTANFVASGGEDGTRRFRRSTCLVENAERLRRLRLAEGTVLDVLLVGPADDLPPAAIQAMSSPPCRLHRPQAIYDDLVARHRRLVDAVGGPYSVHGFAFLRWPLIDALFPDEPVLCYDGDILHNVPLVDLGRAFAGITATATSTMFAAIFDRGWFDAWRRALDLLDRDLAGFIARRAVPALPPWCRFEASPEEFLAKILIEDGELPQDRLPDDFPFWVAPQPQVLPRLFHYVRPRGGPARIPTPMRYRREGGTDLINDRPMAFWHLQKPFLAQLAAVAVLREKLPDVPAHRIPPMSYYGEPSTAARNRENDPYVDEGGTPLVPPEHEALARRMLALERRSWTAPVPLGQNAFTPTFLARYFFRDNDLSPLFNDRTWPVPGIWADAEARSA